jgi:Deuterolysin metalloprotease (M35) family
MKPFTYFGLAAFLGLAASKAIHQHAPGIEVKLHGAGNSAIKATIKNTGSKPLRLLKEGTIFDSAPVQKVHVKSQGEECSTGAKSYCHTHNLYFKTGMSNLRALGRQ